MNTTGRALAGMALAASLALAGTVMAADPAATTPAKKPATVGGKRLDLRKPDITELYTPAQIQAMLASTRDGRYEEIEVQGERVPVTPNVWRGLAAPVWALFNPLQAWRIVAPIPPDRIHAADVRPESVAYERDPFRP